MTLKPYYLISEIIAKVEVSKVHGKKFVKRAMITCANEVLGQDDATTLNAIPFNKCHYHKKTG